MTAFFRTIIAWYMSNINYFTITCLMTIESSFLPLPSEVVIPPAAFKAANGELNIILVILCATIGSIIGALFNYTISMSLGRAVIHRLARTKLAHLIMIDEHSIERAEAYFNKFGRSSTFFGRLLPVIRHLISIPAGLSKMKLRDFILFTAIGSFIWNITLSLLGYFLYFAERASGQIF